MEIITPETDKLVELLKRELMAGNISPELAEKVSLYMINSTQENVDILRKLIGNEKFDEINRARWIGFGLGIIATLVVGAVVLTTWLAYFV
jgi:hypothetical protein